VEPKKLEEIDLVILKGLQANERELRQFVDRHQKDVKLAMTHIAERHGLDVDDLGVKYGFDLEAGQIVAIEPQPNPQESAPATPIDPRGKKKRGV